MVRKSIYLIDNQICFSVALKVALVDGGFTI